MIIFIMVGLSRFFFFVVFFSIALGGGGGGAAIGWRKSSGEETKIIEVREEFEKKLIAAFPKVRIHDRND